ncbi:MAG: hypothetical protein GW906_06860 [Epsilonproteobacteria bacterium]|nr:hypothetical protein [Campylobacterota bacterium]PIP10804.1 MAG: hypothetical protein COX50_04200 [Sulfurimonas sp. CG23_combo_of_CG06-09_8_20_14_all_36_33]PIS24265.1 MAG: hypothetical protein COT46_10205 [Sulfurimonas sp. CG08_land_8_20_14_0_20_36_33]PIU36070.1 MAG: hypothetical protein COT05_01045 [Sulfurimonas sp. CG07_land_8_20_14_0_80_36_56]PIV04415.1 MAG: hypothetical protein COS56_05160 [Sulfurimonas sp. CG03_land_8_20_14_0_80_36_25]PIV34396.1 MAG: hypothetical protein COS32_10455 [S
MFSEIKNIFVLTFILGGFLIVYGNYSGYYLITIILSILIMLIYFFTTLYLNTRKRQISMEQLADSNYYLGFMFTLMSILVSLIGTVSNSYDIDNIINNFGVSMITTLMGLLARVYLANFIPTNESNKEIINQSISDKMRMMNEILLDNMQKNKVFSQMIDVRMTILVESTQEALEQFKKLLDEDFKSTIKTFNDSIKNITLNMENTHKKQTKILSTEYEKVKKKSEEYEEVIDNQKKVITEFGAQIKKSPK